MSDIGYSAKHTNALAAGFSAHKTTKETFNSQVDNGSNPAQAKINSANKGNFVQDTATSENQTVKADTQQNVQSSASAVNSANPPNNLFTHNPKNNNINQVNGQYRNNAELQFEQKLANFFNEREQKQNPNLQASEKSAVNSSALSTRRNPDDEAESIGSTTATNTSIKTSTKTSRISSTEISTKVSTEVSTKDAQDFSAQPTSENENLSTSAAFISSPENDKQKPAIMNKLVKPTHTTSSERFNIVPNNLMASHLRSQTSTSHSKPGKHRFTSSIPTSRSHKRRIETVKRVGFNYVGGLNRKFNSVNSGKDKDKSDDK